MRASLALKNTIHNLLIRVKRFGSEFRRLDVFREYSAPCTQFPRGKGLPVANFNIYKDSRMYYKPTLIIFRAKPDFSSLRFPQGTPEPGS
jgi:hypothetical protein